MSILEHVRPGDVIAVEQVLGEPTALVEALGRHAPELPGVRLFVGMSLTDAWSRVPPGIGLITSVGMPPNSQLIASGRMQLVPCHMSQLPWLLTSGPLAADVAMVLISPPDADGWCSLGVTSDYIWAAVQRAPVLLAEINPNVPVLAGDTRIHRDQVTWSMRTERPLPQYERATPGELDFRIAANVAAYVHDGSCLQIGIGRVGEAVLQLAADRRDLGVHSGMIGDTLLELMRDGVVTNRRKGADRGLSVAGSVLGSHRGLAIAAGRDDLRVRSIEHTHDTARVAALPGFLCVNSALEVDLLGRVNSETGGGRYVGGIGGSVDFLRAAMIAPDARSVVALPATTGRGRSRIVPRVETVTALGADVDMIATEHGVAEVRGETAAERMRRIIAIAAPDQRDALRSAAEELGR